MKRRRLPNFKPRRTLVFIDSRVEANRALLGRGKPTGSGLIWSSRGDAGISQTARLGGGTAATLAAEQLMKTLALLIFDDRFHDELAPFLAIWNSHAALLPLLLFAPLRRWLAARRRLLTAPPTDFAREKTMRLFAAMDDYSIAMEVL